MALVSVIILNYNGKQYLRNCLESVSHQTFKDLEIILVDNGSEDGSVNYVAINFPECKIVKNTKNLGFAEGNNIAIKHAKGDYIVLLNNDTEVKQDWLEELVRAAQSDSSVGICGSKLLSMDAKNVIQEVGGLCDLFGFTVNRGVGEIDNGQYNNVAETFYVSGASLLIKRELIEKIGLFDQEFFVNAEDVDLCWRAHLAGYKVLVNPLSIVYHKGGGTLPDAPNTWIGSADKNGNPFKYTTSSKRRYFSEKNALRMILKNYDYLTLLTIIPIFLMLYIAEIGLYLVTGRFNTVIGNLKALIWNLTHLSNTLCQRKKVQKMRKVDDKVILGKMIRTSAKIRRFKQVGIPNFR